MTSIPRSLLATVTLILATASGHAQERPRAVPPTGIAPGPPGPTQPAPDGRPQIRIYDFSMNPSGIKLDRSTLAAGRVKVPPFSVASHRLEFEVFDPQGKMVYAGSIDHPLWHEVEADHPREKGRRQRQVHARPGHVFHLRLPDVTNAARVAFVAVIVEAGKPPSRRAVGEVQLAASDGPRSP